MGGVEKKGCRDLKLLVSKGIRLSQNGGCWNGIGFLIKKGSCALKNRTTVSLSHRDAQSKGGA